MIFAVGASESLPLSLMELVAADGCTASGLGRRSSTRAFFAFFFARAFFALGLGWVGVVTSKSPPASRFLRESISRGAQKGRKRGEGRWGQGPHRHLYLWFIR